MYWYSLFWVISYVVLATREGFIKMGKNLEAAESGIHCVQLPAVCVCVFVCLHLTLHHKKALVCEEAPVRMCGRASALMCEQILRWGEETGPPGTMQGLAPAVATSPWIRAVFLPLTKSSLWLCLPWAAIQRFTENEGGRHENKE